MLSCPREHLGRQNIDSLFILKEAIGIILGNFPYCLAFGQGRQDHLIAAGLDQFLAHVANVGDVLDVVYINAVHQ